MLESSGSGFGDEAAFFMCAIESVDLRVDVVHKPPRVDNPVEIFGQLR
jgi:hypothetical protein